MRGSDNNKPRVVLASRKNVGIRVTLPVSSAPHGALDDKRIQEAASSPIGLPLFVIPSSRGDGFRASIRGHVLELADPSSGRGPAPTPDDLRTASIASDFAWFARHFLRDRGLDDYVSVAARQCTTEGSPRVDAVELAVTVAKQDAATRATLATALEREFAGKFPDRRLRFHVGAE
jgi:hypothetical protein